MLEQHANCSNARNLTEHELKRQYDSWLSYGQSWIGNTYLFSTFSERLLPGNETSPELFKHYQEHEYRQALQPFQPREQRRCKINKKSREIMDNSICPWYIEYSFDELRYPRILLSAKCKCSKCMGRKYRTERKEYGCVPVKIKIKVLRRKITPEGKLICNNGTADYESTWEHITISCTCTRRPTGKVKHTVSGEWYLLVDKYAPPKAKAEQPKVSAQSVGYQKYDVSESLNWDRYEDSQMGYLQSSENLNKLQSVFR